MDLIWFFRNLNKLLRDTPLLGHYYKRRLRRRVALDIALTVLIGLYSYVSSFFMWWIALACSKRLAVRYHQIFIKRMPFEYVTELINLRDKHKVIRIVQVAIYMRVEHTEALVDYETTLNYVNYMIDKEPVRYKEDDFTLEDRLLISKIACYFTFDEVKRLLRNQLSRWEYTLLKFLSLRNLTEPDPQEFILTRYNSKWFAGWVDCVLRNPRHTGFYLSDFWRTCDISNHFDAIQTLQSVVYGEGFVEGIGTVKLGEHFYYLEVCNRVYWHYQISHPEKPIWMQAGFGYLKAPKPDRYRPYLGVSLRRVTDLNIF